MKTMAIRLEDDLHAQLGVIAQLDGQTITDVIRQAIEAHIEARRSAPELTAKASDVLAEIDREAASRRSAIAAMFSSEATPHPAKAAAKRSSPKGESPEA